MTVVDWDSKPEPWRTIGLKARADFDAIANGRPLPRPDADRDRREIPAECRDIARRRRALGLSQYELGRRAGLWRADVSHAETGFGAWASVAKRCAAALDCLEAERAQS